MDINMNEVKSEEEKIEDVIIELQYKEAWTLLVQKGLNINERNKVRSAFSEWGRQFDVDVEYDHKNKYYLSKLKPNYIFNTKEEVKFFNALYKFSKADSEKVIQIMGIVVKLLDIDSEFKFK